jgi:hypothetical protein
MLARHSSHRVELSHWCRHSRVMAQEAISLHEGPSPASYGCTAGSGPCKLPTAEIHVRRQPTRQSPRLSARNRLRPACTAPSGDHLVGCARGIRFRRQGALPPRQGKRTNPLQQASALAPGSNTTSRSPRSRWVQHPAPGLVPRQIGIVRRRSPYRVHPRLHQSQAKPTRPIASSFLSAAVRLPRQIAGRAGQQRTRP